MRGESGVKRGQLRGYLFEIVILELLDRNGFHVIDVINEPDERVREQREGFIELKGRGCWHQIDCPCDYSTLIPFTYPLRLLGEVKFFKIPLEKKYIREYIGVIKDIQENYFVADNMNFQDAYPRKMEVGVYFSANGFQEEAEKLAYAHGIKTISYQNNFIVNRLKNAIQDLEENYLSVKCMRDSVWGDFRHEFREAIHYGYVGENLQGRFQADGYLYVLEELRNRMRAIQTSFIATTATGVFIHFVSEGNFPTELFRETDVGECHVYYERDDFGNRYFWMEIRGDDNHAKFYFTPPETLDLAALYGREIVLNEKERVFRVLNVSIQLEGIERSLRLHLDEDWLDAARERY